MNQFYKSEARANISDQSQPAVWQRPHYLSQLAGLAIVGQIFLFLSAWLLPIVSEYRLIGDNMSELVLGQYGFVQTLAFLIAGVGTLGLALAVRQLTRGSWGSFTGSLLLSIYGVGAILVAIFPTDRIDSPAEVWSQSPIGMIHITISIISFLCIIVGMFVLAWTFSRQARWQSLSPWFWSAVLPGAALSLFFAQAEGPLVGLLQRLLVAVISVWLIMVALRVRSIVASEESS
jgi:hypothetical protein